METENAPKAKWKSKSPVNTTYNLASHCDFFPFYFLFNTSSRTARHDNVRTIILYTIYARTARASSAPRRLPTTQYVYKRDYFDVRREQFSGFRQRGEGAGARRSARSIVWRHATVTTPSSHRDRGGDVTRRLRGRTERAGSKLLGVVRPTGSAVQWFSVPQQVRRTRNETPQRTFHAVRPRRRRTHVV